MTSPSGNDSFANATDLGSVGLVSVALGPVDVSANTTEAGEPQAASSSSRSAWWKFTPSASGAVRLQMSDSVSAALYTGTTLAGLTLVGQLDQYATGPQYTQQVTGGTTYYVQIGYSSSTALSGSLLLAARPANDDWANAVAIDLSGGYQTVTSSAVDGRYATVEPGEYNVSGGDRTTWWKITPPADGVINFVGNTYAYYETFTGTTLAGLTMLTGASLSSGGYPDYPLKVTAGTTYYLRLRNAESATATITVEYGAPPANDDFANAAPIDTSAGTATVTVSNRFATGEPNEVQSQGTGYRSCWYKYTPYSSGNLTLTITSGPTNVALWTGSTVSSLTGLGNAYYGPLTVAVTAGTTYWIQAGQAGYSVGTSTFTVAGPSTAAPPAPRSFSVGRATTSTTARTVAPTGSKTYSADFTAGAPLPAGMRLSSPGVFVVGDTDIPTATGVTGSLRISSPGDSHVGLAELPITLVADGTVSFWIKTSCENTYDKLWYTVDGTDYANGWTGETAWTQIGPLTLTAGAHTLKWSYRKDGSVSAGSDAAWIAGIQITHTASDATTANAGMATALTFEDGTVPAAITTTTWTNSTDSPISGTRSMRSPAVPAGSIAYDMTVAVPSLGYDASLQFDFKVSSEANFDLFKVLIGSTEVLSRSSQSSGQTYYGTANIVVPAGMTAVTFRYVKDGTGDAGADAAWVDNLRLPTSATTPAAQSIAVGRATVTSSARPVALAVAPRSISVARATATATGRPIAASSVTTYLSDTVTRANSTTAAGTPDVGGPYTAQTGTWGVSSNQLYTPTSTAAAKLTFPAARDVKVSADFTIGSSQTLSGLIVRWTDASNYLMWGPRSSQRAGFTAFIGGTSANVGPDAAYTGTVTTLSVIAYGNYVYGYLNGTLLCVVEDFSTGTVAGVRINSSTTQRVDNLLAQSVSAVPGGIDGSTVGIYKGRDTATADTGSVA